LRKKKGRSKRTVKKHKGTDSQIEEMELDASQKRKADKKEIRTQSKKLERKQ
jgi:hypothetical protein